MSTYPNGTLMTWTSKEAKTANVDLYNARESYVQNLVDQGKTDGVSDNINEFQTARVWLDQATAQAWSTWITETAANNGGGLISVAFFDNP
jgi:hypothetical protein